jgi:phosphonate transport system substrate-binding protein
VSVGFASLVSSASDAQARRLLADLTGTGLDFEAISGPWEDRLESLRNGNAGAGWLCGFLHMNLAETENWPFRAVAAARSNRPGFEGQPVYFGDVIVRSDSRHQSFEDLAGTIFAYNETSSLSGFHMMLDHLRADGKDLSFFSSTIASGSHLASIDTVADGSADCAIIDSTILDSAMPDTVRTILSVGPYPAPPIVSIDAYADQIRQALEDHRDWALAVDDDYAELRTSV